MIDTEKIKEIREEIDLADYLRIQSKNRFVTLCTGTTIILA